MGYVVTENEMFANCRNGKVALRLSLPFETRLRGQRMLTIVLQKKKKRRKKKKGNRHKPSRCRLTHVNGTVDYRL